MGCVSSKHTVVATADDATRVVKVAPPPSTKKMFFEISAIKPDLFTLAHILLNVGLGHTVTAYVPALDMPDVPADVLKDLKRGRVFLKSILDAAPNLHVFDDLAAARADHESRPMVERQTAAPPILYDAFLGGACGSSTWRAEWLAHMAGLRLFNPQLPAGTPWDDSYAVAEEEAKSASRFLVFVIDGQTSAVMSMMEAAYYIGLGRDVVLALADYELPSDGFKDEDVRRVLQNHINGVRVFLKEQAAKDQFAKTVAVFGDHETAMHYLARRAS